MNSQDQKKAVLWVISFLALSLHYKFQGKGANEWILTLGVKALKSETEGEISQNPAITVQTAL